LKHAAIKAGRPWPPRIRKSLKLTWADARDFPSCAWALRRATVLCDVTATQIIEEIKRLPSKQKAEVLSALLRSQKNKGMLSPDELVALADRMVATKDPEEADRLEKEIIAGFYGRWTMPRIRRKGIPPPLMAHLIKRVRERDISTPQLGLLSRWLDTEPEVPDGQWFKRFPEMIVCGEGDLVKTFLIEGQNPTGTEIK